MTRLSQFSLIFVLITFTSCGPSTPELKGFDRNKWKNDQNGCNQQREDLCKIVLANKDQLLGLGEMDIIEVLGNPDQQELYSRNQKFYRYYLTPNQKCSAPSSIVKKLVVRFNAVGLAKEINIE